MARYRRRAHGLAQRQRVRAHAFLEEPQSQRPVVVGRVAEVDVARRRRRRARGLTAAELLEPLRGALVDQLDLRLCLQPQLHPRLRGQDLRFHVLEELLDRGRREVDALRQLDAVQLMQLVAQHRVDLGLGRFRLDQVLVAHALLARHFHRDQQQGEC